VAKQSGQAQVPATAQEPSKGAVATKNYIDILKSDTMRGTIAQVLPGYLDAQRFMGMALEAAKAFAASPKVVKESILIAVFQAAKLGLYFDKMLGEAHMVPFKTPDGRSLITMIPGYKGLIKLAKKSGDKLVDVKAYIIYDKDEFAQWIDGDGPHFRHVPSTEDDLGRMLGGYALFWLKGEDKPRYHYVSGQKIRKIKSSALSRGGAVWKSWEEDMWLKTIIRQAMKLLDLSPDLTVAIARDELIDSGKIDSAIPDELTGIVDGEYQEVANQVNASADRPPEGEGKPTVATPQAKKGRAEAGAAPSASGASQKSGAESQEPPPPAEDKETKLFQDKAMELAGYAGITDLDSWLLSEMSIPSLSMTPTKSQVDVIKSLEFAVNETGK